jgi:hypothetical protein
MNGTSLQLNETPGTLIIEDEGVLPDEYFITKTTK